MSREPTSAEPPVIDVDNKLQAHQQALIKLLKEFDRVCRSLSIPYVLFAGTMLGAVRHQGFIPWDDDLDVLMLREDYERFLLEAETVLDRKTFFLQKEFSEHWPMFFSKLRLNNTTCIEKFHPKDLLIHQGIYMDIFPCDRAADSNFGRKLQFLASKVVIAKSLDARGYDTDSKIKKLFMKVCKYLPAAPFIWYTKTGNKHSGMRHSFFAAASCYEKNVYPESYFTNTVDADFEDGKYQISACFDNLLRQLYGDYMRIPLPEERTCKQHAILIDTDRSYEEYLHYHDGMHFDVYTRSIR